MAKGANQKLKLLYLMDILLEETDENHGLSLEQITEKLRARGVEAERKSLYNDFDQLRTYGLDVEKNKVGRNYYYYVFSREFELAELKLLVDAVQSSKFITLKKSEELIKKLEKLTSRYQARDLTRQVFVQKRIKTMNETIYYNVDAIHQAINQNVQIRFQYFQWNVKKEMVPRHNGKIYQISPWGLSWDDENYYMIGYDPEADRIKHYRVDKMVQVEETEEDRQGKEKFEKIDMAEYSKKLFSMYEGKEASVRIRFADYLVGVVIDRFGKDVTLRPDGEGYFVAHVNVMVSNQFLGWIMALGQGACIQEPVWVKDKLKELAMETINQYD
ncbi:MAG: WYL domain-containing protein [Eubacterium sp.]|nr:WYL domain-containing protein [Eubacterium sp.]